MKKSKNVLPSVSETLKPDNHEYVPLLKWQHRSITGLIAGFSIQGVIYKSGMLILRIHTDRPVEMPILSGIDTPQSLVDIRCSGCVLDFLFSISIYEHQESEAYLERVLTTIDESGIKPAIGEPLQDESSLTRLQQCVSVTVMIFMSFMMIVGASYLAFYFQLGQFLVRDGTISIQYYSYLIPFFSPFIISSVIVWLDRWLGFTESVRFYNRIQYYKLGGIILMFLMSCIVGFFGIIHQGALVLRTSAPYTLNGFFYIKYYLQTFGYFDVYIYGFILNTISWIIIMGNLIMGLLKEKHSR